MPQFSKSLSFSASDDNALERFNIVQVDMLYLQPKATLRQEIITSRNVSDDKLWSNDNMYKHLSFLASSFTNRVCLLSLTLAMFYS